jgi:hypothetical protein
MPNGLARSKNEANPPETRISVLLTIRTQRGLLALNRPNPNTHDTSRKVIILQVGRGPVANRVPLVDKTVTSIKSTS